MMAFQAILQALPKLRMEMRDMRSEMNKINEKFGIRGTEGKERDDLE